jgi:hypothetical protein
MRRSEHGRQPTLEECLLLSPKRQHSLKQWLKKQRAFGQPQKLT